jgi:histidinol-phosphate phosphatase family protein
MSKHSRAGVLFDRDGVINLPPAPEDRYITRPEDFHLMPGTAEAIALLNKLKVPVAVVTNQKCVAIGRITAGELKRIHDQMHALLAGAGAWVDRVYTCPHEEADACNCRKPKPGMLLQAAADLSLNLNSSWLIGDQPRDIAAGRAAGCHTLRVGPEVSMEAGEEVHLLSTRDLPAWVREKSGFASKEDCQPED